MSIFNINDITNGLILIFISIMGSFTYKLLACPMQKVLAQNIVVRHLSYLALVLFTTSFLSDNKINPIYHFVKALVIYFFIVVSTKMNVKLTGALFCILLIIYTSHMYIKYYEYQKNIDTSEKLSYQNKIDNLNKLNNILLILVLLIMVYGFIDFTILKKSQYGRKFNLFKLLFGSRLCVYE